MNQTNGDPMETEWHCEDAEPMHAGQDGSDDAAGESWSVRFVRVPNPIDGVYAVVTVNVFPIECYDHEEIAERRAEFATAHEDDSLAIERFNAENPLLWAWREQVEFLQCTDIDDPGGTEIWSDYDYEESPLFSHSLESADSAARQEAERWIAMGTDYFLNWDGVGRNGFH